MTYDEILKQSTPRPWRGECRKTTIFLVGRLYTAGRISEL